ncbi:flagellar hook-associated protein FlgK [Psychromonas sp. Urea-02u-13]|uniref:flagellar hook-associated protein FlgK n=1 Tax=Psychromonas sp. Urea-02u-13 TaxID=2058326 RepID=UPI000C322740|nr:flagellar hook-associated protein FlgK [Psychromonas sp. Urea-02u-13]PKG38628.1 flagellar hook-associated protein FlgK [Psychromonas sp. Urea-02u-13]
MADLFQIGLSGIYSSQAKLNTTGHNIANINTEGYSRQSAEVVSGGADRFGNYFIGRGSIVEGVERAYDKFAFTENILNTSQASYTKEVFQQSSQMDMLLSDESTSVIKPVLQTFESMNGVVNKPNMLESRTVFLESAGNMVNQYNRLYDNLEIQYTGINNDIVNTAKTVTTLADNLANLNKQISIVLGNGGQSNANDLLDKRDQAITELSQYVDVSVVPADNGMVNVYIGSGQSLVMGGTSLEMIAVNGDPDPSRKELAFNIDGNMALISGERLGGKISAMFGIRNNDLERAFNQLGQSIIGLTHSINEQQKEGMTLEGKIGEDLFNDVNSLLSMRNRVLAHDDGLGSAQLSVRIDDLGALTPDDFELVVEAYAVGPPETISFSSTNRATGEMHTGLTASNLGQDSRIEIPNSGISIGIDAITALDPPQVGKTFTLRPTRLAAHDASLQHKDPSKIAAADAEIKTVSGDANTGTAELRTKSINNPLDPLYMDKDNPLTIDITAVNPATGEITYSILDKNGTAVTLPAGSANNYVPAKAVGAPLSGLTLTPDPLTGKVTFNLADIDVEMIKGSPAAGDQFTLNYNETADGDSRNIMKMADLQTQKIMNDGKATFSDVYSGMLSEIGAKTANAEVSMESSAILQRQSFDRIQAMSGVNMDEEAANLLQYQQHYSAAARVISVATELFDTILQASR